MQQQLLGALVVEELADLGAQRLGEPGEVVVEALSRVTGEFELAARVDAAHDGDDAVSYTHLTLPTTPYV